MDRVPALAVWVVASSFLFATGCRKKVRVSPGPGSGREVLTEADSGTPTDDASAPRFVCSWDPATGKGKVTQHLVGGDRYELCLQCRFPGYAGGLWAGSMNGSGFQWIPPEPVRGFKSLNLICAQDESIYDETAGLEYDAGWSENFGKGADGVRLEYLGGEIVSDGSVGDLVLRSVNGAGCWQVSRYLLWPRGTDYVVISSAIENTCKDRRIISFWTGEDPWIGRYRTSEGDVGWYSGGIVKTELALEGSQFRWGGMYDLGNDLTGEDSSRFSNVANFHAVDPSLPAPSVAFFANRFAHAAEDIEPGRPLDNKSLTAFNLGWTKIALAAGDDVRFRYAFGRALTFAPGDQPRPPKIPAEHWSFDDVYRRAEESEFSTKAGTGDDRHELPLQFAEEIIRMRVDPPDIHMDTLYIFRNRTPASQNSSIFYPFPVDDDHPYPFDIEVEGAPSRQVERGLIWNLATGPHEEISVGVKYSQHCPANSGRYILTSTAAWDEPLEKAAFEVRWPAALANVHISYAGTLTEEKGEKTLRFEKEDFLPDRDLVVEWK